MGRRGDGRHPNPSGGAQSPFHRKPNLANWCQSETGRSSPLSQTWPILGFHTRRKSPTINAVEHIQTKYIYSHRILPGCYQGGSNSFNIFLSFHSNCFVNTSEIKFGQMLHNERIKGVLQKLLMFFKIQPNINMCEGQQMRENKDVSSLSHEYDNCCIFWFGLVLELRLLCCST